MTRCLRCGDGEPAAHVDTLTVRINEAVELVRAPLCGPCRGIVSSAIRAALHPLAALGS